MAVTGKFCFLIKSNSINLSILSALNSDVMIGAAATIW